jgi:putative transposase
MSLETETENTATMGEVAKTLELRPVDPNIHKRQKLRETRDAYQQALQAAFAAGCDTQSAANDVVVEYLLHRQETPAEAWQ